MLFLFLRGGFSMGVDGSSGRGDGGDEDVKMPEEMENLVEVVGAKFESTVRKSHETQGLYVNDSVLIL